MSNNVGITIGKNTKTRYDSLVQRQSAVQGIIISVATNFFWMGWLNTSIVNSQKIVIGY